MNVKILKAQDESFIEAHTHTTHVDRYQNLICTCGKIFIRNMTLNTKVV